MSGRFSTAGGSMPVCANLLHHAIELMLKACLARDDPRDVIEKYGFKSSYGHMLPTLWVEFKNRNSSKSYSEFDEIIVALHKFEDIRYPEKLIKNGAAITIDPFENEHPTVVTGTDPTERYSLTLPPIDRLMKSLFDATRTNLAFFSPEIETFDRREALYYPIVKATILGRTPPADPGMDKSKTESALEPRDVQFSKRLAEVAILTSLAIAATVFFVFCATGKG